MATRTLWGVAAKFMAVGTAVAGGTAGATILTSDDPPATFKLWTNVPVRLFRDAFTAASIAFDYEYSLLGLPEGSTEYSKMKHEVHIRSALKLQDLCFRNGGIYIKLGQHIGQLEYLVPEEYVKTMRESMLNKCPVSSYDQVCDVIKKELGGMPNEIFAKFDPAPIASASLAQVHVAQLHNGQEVAVKVQHAHMTDTAAADYATVELIVNTLHRLFPNFDYRWLVAEVRESLPKELDFLVEAQNSQKCLHNFQKLSPHISDSIYVPLVYWNMSTKKLLTMEYIDGVQIDDVKGIRKMGILPYDVSRLISEAFAEMIYKHGFVHCDPHAANLIVRPLPSGKRNILGKRKPQLVLLDHGLYKELDFDTRVNYAALWKGLVFSDEKAIRENSAKLGAGDDLYALFAGILTMRPWNRVIDTSVDHLMIQGTENDRSELQMYASQYFPQISELLRRLPRVILLMLKTNDCLRSVNNVLLQGSSLDTFLIIGRVSSEAVIQAKLMKKKSLITWLIVWLEGIILRARLLGMHFGIWLLHFQNILLYRKSLGC
ncbi:putative ABC1 protein At2g40090 [Chenopodium quinoa]|uniref:ABC1 atypical kinase-like domain-containing protein n=1 Tax=Chenopodium quinoa TaxID=63459 RepID=A0A803M3S5_CHEQI|nr:putative ABC1 protein At2g40090 [Chenopodium quinoa]